jgi:hypothetical protein
MWLKTYKPLATMTVVPRIPCLPDPNRPPPGGRKYSKKYKLRDGVAALYAERINERLDEEEAGPAGSKKYLSLYPAMLTQVAEDLHDEELDAVQKIVDKWNSDGAPDDMKKK